ncbi:e3 ubiquitin-protein ligase UBR3, partial [Caerostris extrusa]
VQRGQHFEPLKKKSCFVPLLNVLYLHSRLLSQTIDKNQQMDYAVNVWSRLTGLLPVNRNSLTSFDVEVPLILRDPIAILLQIILALPTNIDKAYFKCTSSSNRNELNQTAAQKLKGVVACLEDGDCQDLESKMKDLKIVLGFVIGRLEFSSLYVEDDEMDSTKSISSIEDACLEQHVREYCLHFLKIAALLQSHLFEENIELKNGHNFLDVVFPMQIFKNYGRTKLPYYTKWYPPSLLLLPHNYDDIFKYYHKKTCTMCHSEPKDPSLCLICGTMVCLRENCCRRVAHYEAVSHSVLCGAGTAIYLAVNSSTIIVIRGKRACLWGSVYLDSFGEEDRDLKRGKPLFLSEERYSLLQQQWINHSFDHTNKRWVWHKDNL